MFTDLFAIFDAVPRFVAQLLKPCGGFVTVGMNNGWLQGFKYFDTEPQRGVFTPPRNVTLEPEVAVPEGYLPDPPQGHLVLGDLVCAGDRVGHVRFLGSTRFAPGSWVGMELLKPGASCAFLWWYKPPPPPLEVYQALHPPLLTPLGHVSRSAPYISCVLAPWSVRWETCRDG